MARLTLNKVMVSGNIVREPEVSEVGNNTVCNTSVAINEVYYTAEGEKREETCFIEISAWGKVGERLAQASKGDNVFVEGKLKLDQWETDGEKRQKHRINVLRFTNLSAASAASEDSEAEEKVETKTAKKSAAPTKKHNPFKSDPV